MHLPKYSNRRVTKKIPQLQSVQLLSEVQPESRHPVDSSARVKITLHMVHLECVTVQLYTFKRTSSKNLVTKKIQLHSRYPADSSAKSC